MTNERANDIVDLASLASQKLELKVIETVLQFPGSVIAPTVILLAGKLITLAAGYMLFVGKNEKDVSVVFHEMTTAALNDAVNLSKTAKDKGVNPFISKEIKE